jgi:signal transduction histidine kinase
MFEFQAARNMFSRSPQKAIATLDDAIAATEHAIAESRDAIQDLRSEPVGGVDLPELLTQASRELAASYNGNHAAPAFRMIVEGDRRALSPTVEDAVSQIAREVLRNAFRHAEAHAIEAEIRYDADEFRLRLRDDGKGISAAVLGKGGRAGHWGLSGMRERAQQIGAQLNVWSEVGAGTEVQLTVPGAVAYGRPRESFRAKLFGKVGSRVERS